MEEYKIVDNKQEILNSFLLQLWKSKYTFKKYKKYYKFKVYNDLLDNRQDLIDLFNKYNSVEYTICKSFYKKRLDSIDYIRIHINNMYGALFDKEVYYKNQYYKLLLTPKREYFRLVKIKRSVGNLDEINFDDIENTINDAFREAEIIKQKSINRKNNMVFKDYKKLINIYVEKIFNNYISAEEYERKHGWELNISVDGWSEDNYVIKYFNKSLTGYIKTYINKMNNKNRYKKYIECSNCGILFSPTNNINKYCNSCAKEIEKGNWAERKRRQRNREKECHETENS